MIFVGLGFIYHTASRFLAYRYVLYKINLKWSAENNLKLLMKLSIIMLNSLTLIGGWETTGSCYASASLFFRIRGVLRQGRNITILKIHFFPRPFYLTSKGSRYRCHQRTSRVLVIFIWHKKRKFMKRNVDLHLKIKQRFLSSKIFLSSPSVERLL